MPTPSITDRLDKIEQLITRQSQKPLSSDEACAFMHVSKSTLYKMTSRGDLVYYKSAGHKLIHFLEDDLRNWVMAHRVASNQEIAREVNQ